MLKGPGHPNTAAVGVVSILVPRVCVWSPHSLGTELFQVSLQHEFKKENIKTFKKRARERRRDRGREKRKRKEVKVIGLHI